MLSHTALSIESNFMRQKFESSQILLGFEHWIWVKHESLVTNANTYLI